MAWDLKKGVEVFARPQMRTGGLDEDANHGAGCALTASQLAFAFLM
jgi:hypothetical protein